MRLITLRRLSDLTFTPGIRISGTGFTADDYPASLCSWGSSWGLPSAANKALVNLAKSPGLRALERFSNISPAELINMVVGMPVILNLRGVLESVVKPAG